MTRTVGGHTLRGFAAVGSRQGFGPAVGIRCIHSKVVLSGDSAFAVCLLAVANSRTTVIPTEQHLNGGSDEFECNVDGETPRDLDLAGSYTQCTYMTS